MNEKTINEQYAYISVSYTHLAATGYNRLNISRYTAASMTGNSRFVTLRDAYFKGWDHVSNKAEAAYPSLTNTESKNYANSDFWLEDASFVKLKNVSISYRIPRRVAKFASIDVYKRQFQRC